MFPNHRPSVNKRGHASNTSIDGGDGAVTDGRHAATGCDFFCYPYHHRGVCWSVSPRTATLILTSNGDVCLDDADVVYISIDQSTNRCAVRGSKYGTSKLLMDETCVNTNAHVVLCMWVMQRDRTDKRESNPSAQRVILSSCKK